MTRRRNVRSACGTNSRHWFAGEATCTRCGATNPSYVAAPDGPPVVHAVDRKLDRLAGFTRILASYGCADAMEPDEPSCGKCAPCEAAAYLKEIGRA
jgi:hypothetical protein